MRQEDGLVACPVCQTRMKDWQVFKHLESCPGPTPLSKVRAGESSSIPSSNRMRTQQNKPLERLPTLNYSMLREQALRKKLAELGIPNYGPRLVLENRHREWITIWNANCDAARPKKRSELLHDLDVWERTQGGRVPTFSRSVHSAVMVKDKEFDGAAWAVKHDDSFKDLIASARKSRMEAKKRVENPTSELASASSKELAAPGSIPSGATQEQIPTNLAPLPDENYSTPSAVHTDKLNLLETSHLAPCPTLSERQPSTAGAKDPRSTGNLGSNSEIETANGTANPFIPFTSQ